MITGNINNSINNNSYNPYSTNKVDMDFINLINNRITGYGQIPYTVPVNLIIDVIKSSAKWFYEWSSRTWHNSFFLIDTKDIISQDDNNITKTIIIDPRIIIINKIYENSANYRRKDDFSALDIQTTISGSYLATNTVGINNNLFMIENAVRMTELSAIKNMFGNSLAYFHSWDNATLTLKNKPKSSSILIDCLVCNDISKLYKMAYFERHVIANVKKELKRILASHTIQLPGGATLNPDEICNNIEDATDIEDKIRLSNGIGDIIVKR